MYNDLITLLIKQFSFAAVRSGCTDDFVLFPFQHRKFNNSHLVYDFLNTSEFRLISRNSIVNQTGFFKLEIYFFQSISLSKDTKY
jgi:hypothetical protein